MNRVGDGWAGSKNGPRLTGSLETVNGRQTVGDAGHGVTLRGLDFGNREPLELDS